MSREELDRRLAEADRPGWLCGERQASCAILSTRERDLEDAAHVLRALSERMDQAAIDAEAARLAAEIADHDIAQRLARARELSVFGP